MLREIAIPDHYADHPFWDPTSETSPTNTRLTAHIYLTQESLADAFAIAFRKLHFPFLNVSLRGISALQNDTSPAQLIPQIQKNLGEGTISIVIGPGSKSFKIAFDALQFDDNAFNTTLVSPNLGALDRTLLEVRKPWLQAFFVVGTQAHLSDHVFMRNAESEGLKSTRLGVLRSDAGIVEPEIRSADLFGLSLNAIKHSDAPIQNTITSTGFAAEEACQYAYYSGRSEKNKICCFFDFRDDAFNHPHGVNLLATLSWYYLHGLNLRVRTYPPSLESMNRYTLEEKVQGRLLTFFKDEGEQKWWLECPASNKALAKSMPLISCAYTDYKEAANEQTLSDRLSHWFKLLDQVTSV